MENHQLKEIFNRYLQNHCSAEEIEGLIKHFDTTAEPYLRSLILTEIEKENGEINKEEQAELASASQEVFSILQQEIQKVKIQAVPNKVIQSTLWKRFAVAASILICFGIASYFVLNKYNSNESHLSQIPEGHDVASGGNRATLTLADGSIIDLSDTQNGIVIDSESIKYTDGSNLFVIQSDGEGSLSTKQANAPERQLTLATPKGGQYQITLPDGTKAWLNAASKLNYPSHFTGKERRVELTGEAYFEVAKNTKQPFIVTSQNQEVTVLGTHFNISAYPDDDKVMTTLVEGSVQVSNAEGKNECTHTLISGEQSVIEKSGKLSVISVPVEDYTAWKDNLFIFHSTSLNNIMKQLSRWYDIEIDYETLPDITYYAEISRNVKLSQVLTMLEESTDLKFKIEATKNGRRITMKN